jgi:hypothetical protein
MHVPWMKKLLAITTFFTTCEVHTNDPKNERNMFCIDCINNPYCGSCIKSHHKDHNVIQVSVVNKFVNQIYIISPQSMYVCVKYISLHFIFLTLKQFLLNF